MKEFDINNMNIINNNLHFNKSKGLVYPFLNFNKQKQNILKSNIFPKNTRQKIIDYYDNLNDKSHNDSVLKCNNYNGKTKEKCCKESFPQNDYLYTTCINSKKQQTNNIFIIIIFIFLIINIINQCQSLLYKRIH